MHGHRIRHVHSALVGASSLLWAAVTPAAVLGTGRELLAVLAPACLTVAALALIRAEERAAERAAQYERKMAEREAQYERREGRLCDVIADDLRGRKYRAARTLPDLRVIR